MTFKPLFDFRATSITKAFLLNALVLCFIAALSIELRRYLDILSETKDLKEVQKLFITIGGTFLMGLIIYIICRLILGFGDGMLASKVNPIRHFFNSTSN